MTSLISVCAPGKVILHGEHAVVYGKKAIACSVNATIQVDLYDSDVAGELIIEFPNLLKGPVKTICISTTLVQNLHQKHPFEKHEDVWQNDLRQFVVAVCPDEEKENKLLVTALSVLVFAYLKIMMCEGKLSYPSFKVCIRSHNLPLGSGLGSSAAFSVSLATSFLLYAKQLQLNDEIELQLDKLSLEKINDISYQMEKLVHGKPSGIDNSVSAYGGAIVFTAGELKRCTDFPKLDFLIVDSRTARSTKTLVSSVRSTVEKFPDLMNRVLQSIHEVSEAAEETFMQMSKCDDRKESSSLFENLKKLIKMNHHLLNCIGVGHSTLDTIFRIAEKFGCACKLTGAGGGGCAIILLDPDSNEERVVKLQDELRQIGFTSWKAVLGGEGVKIRHCAPHFVNASKCES